MSADTPASHHIEIDRAGRKWTGVYRVSGGEIEVQCAVGSRKHAIHTPPPSGEQMQDYLDGLGRLLLVEIIDRHLGLRG